MLGAFEVSKGLGVWRLEFLGLGLAVAVDKKNGLVRVGFGVRYGDDDFRGRLI